MGIPLSPIGYCFLVYATLMALMFDPVTSTKAMLNDLVHSASLYLSDFLIFMASEGDFTIVSIGKPIGARHSKFLPRHNVEAREVFHQRSRCKAKGPSHLSRQGKGGLNVK